jgi:hypothetical protein
MGVVRIPLANDKGFFMIDEEDVALVTQYRWSLAPTCGKLYARAYGGKKKGKDAVVMAHRLILNPGPEWEVDHRDGNGLNNVRSNLRKAIPAYSSTGVRNVFLHARSGRYAVRFNIDRIVCNCGEYGTFEEARDVAERVRARLRD